MSAAYWQVLAQTEVLLPEAAHWVKQASATVVVAPQPEHVRVENPQVDRQDELESRFAVHRA